MLLKLLHDFEILLEYIFEVDFIVQSLILTSRIDKSLIHFAIRKNYPCNNFKMRFDNRYTFLILPFETILTSKMDGELLFKSYGSLISYLNMINQIGPLHSRQNIASYNLKYLKN